MIQFFPNTIKTEETRFIILVKTDNAGVSASNEILLPIRGSDMVVDWGDGNVSTHTQTLEPNNTIGGNNVTHTYVSAGVYQVKISVGLIRIFFNNGGDRLKLLEIQNWGKIVWSNLSGSFFGCSNLLLEAIDYGVFENVTNFFGAWRGCTSLTSFPIINTSKGTNFSNTWRSCTSLTSFPLLDTSKGTDFSNCWNTCNSLTSFPLLDTGKGSNFNSTWINCNSLTSFPLLNTGDGTDFFATWRSCSSLTSFPLLNISKSNNFQDTWRFCSVLNLFPANVFNTSTVSNYGLAFTGTNLSTQSIDNILISLDICGVTNGTFNQSGGNAPSSTGQNAIDNLRAKGWTITVTGGY